jgi:hemerythrin superfamily protein
MDIFRLIMADHEKLSELFEQLHAQRGTSGHRAQIFAQLKEALESHAIAEEQVFYPALQALDVTQELAFEAMEDHRLVKELLAEMASASIGSPEWDEQLEILEENVEEHIAEEESDIFDAARQLFTPKQASELAERWQLARQGQLARSAR